jgi:hypothetical protein
MEYFKSLSLPYMGPNNLPFAVINERYLSDGQCNNILTTMAKIEPYKMGVCGGVTKEMSVPWMFGLRPVEDLVRHVNAEFWQYDLFDETKAWMQTYNTNDSYLFHMDGAPGQMRKLTAIVILSDPEDYTGGTLQFYSAPEYFTPEQKRGTVIVFPHWLLHNVETITSGTRQTINMGFWGPPFR